MNSMMFSGGGTALVIGEASADRGCRGLPRVAVKEPVWRVKPKKKKGSASLLLRFHYIDVATLKVQGIRRLLCCFRLNIFFSNLHFIFNS